MLPYNYHTHTARCNHASGTDREYVEAAIQAGVKELGISDHAPYLFPNTDYYSVFRMKKEELFEYAESVRALQKEYAKDVKILLGFELEYYPDFHAGEMEFLKQVNPDYLILGQHAICNEITNPYGSFMKEEAAFRVYISQAIEGLKTGDFAYMAHPDLPGYNFPKEVYEEEYLKLCKTAKDLNIPLEINLLGLRTNRHYPGYRLFEIAAQVGNQIVLGVDAHNPHEFHHKESVETAMEWIKKLNLQLIDKPFI